jgi:hypothetical protein
VAAGRRVKRVAIHQPHYLPWPGYFDKIRQADLFVYLDNVQFQRRGFQNRNRIKTANSTSWLTVPVHADRPSRIDTVTIADDKWRRRHATAIANAYAQAPHIGLFHDGLRPIIDGSPARLVDLNILVITWAMTCLGIETPVLRASDLGVSGHKEQLILEICERVGATHYLSGEGARCYQQAEHFAQRGLVLEYHMAEVSPYPQCHAAAGFEPDLSTLDLLLNTGGQASGYIQGRRETVT